MPCQVTIQTPDGTFVGAIKDQRTIALQADLQPPSPGASYFWQIIGGPGGGTFVGRNCLPLESTCTLSFSRETRALPQFASEFA
ncbi:MAG: hypothetical protein HYS13_06900 [Planctomycetia bacterium]|nr:hypothetical protein [Planctomycetia bacterium]